MPVSSWKELPDGHPFKGAHVFFKPRPQVSPVENSTAQSPQENLVQALEAKGIKVNLMSKNDLQRRQQDNPKPGEWPRE